jgi:hypothetical protein
MRLNLWQAWRIAVEAERQDSLFSHAFAEDPSDGDGSIGIQSNPSAFPVVMLLCC